VTRNKTNVKGRDRGEKNRQQRARLNEKNARNLKWRILSYSQETKRPSKEMQVTIARQLGLEPTTVGNFFMNARRRSMDKWKDEDPKTVAVEEEQLSPTIGIGQRQSNEVL